MFRITWFKFLIAATTALSLSTFSISPGVSAASTASRSHKVGREIRPNCQAQIPQSPDSKANAPYIHGNAILWQPPEDLESRDLFYGPGGLENAPDPSQPFTYVRRSKSGTQKKIIVQDVNGEKWTVKFGYEARPETAATRIVWAAGYHVDQDYFVAQAQIVGQERIYARNVRFERHDKKYKKFGNWSWKDNPFLGTREFEGLKVMMALLNNWDLKTLNNDILTLKKDHGPDIYYVADLGATFGMTHTFLNKTLLFNDMPPMAGFFSTGKAKGNPSDFANEKFIKEVRGGRVYFNTYRTRIRKALDGVSVENARWIGGILGRLSDKQLSDAFTASGYKPSETALYVSALRTRIIALQRL